MTIEQIAQRLHETLQQIADFCDCDSELYSDGTDHCTCPSCRARAELRLLGDWRTALSVEQLGMQYVTPLTQKEINRVTGPYPNRIAWHARERRLLGAWLGFVDARLMNHIVAGEATVADYRAILGAIRWIGTNVGSTVLDAAGWRYDRSGEDDKDRSYSPSSLFERWTHGLGWIVGIAGYPSIGRDRELDRLAQIARTAVQDVIDYLKTRMEAGRGGRQ
jgi:hypothetical protein